MISKERLKELIKQGATIYSTTLKEEIDLSQYWCEIFEMEWNGKIITKLVVHYDDEHCPLYLLEGLTEDIEGAKWEEEFGCIERTERLELPTYEEKDCIIYTFYSPIKMGGKQYEFRLFKGGNITIWRTDDMYRVFNENTTKENYTLACRKVKELFLGDEDE